MISNTEWQLPWFIHNFKTKCAGTQCRLAIADFGMTEQSQGRRAAQRCRLDSRSCKEDGGWFNKVKTVLYEHISIFGDSNICWMDTDCEIRRCPTGIFDLHRREQDNYMCGSTLDREWFAVDPTGQLWTLVQHWSDRMEGKTSSVSCHGCRSVRRESHRGDQEALYHYLNR